MDGLRRIDQAADAMSAPEKATSKQTKPIHHHPHPGVL
jgi:hypothetical protein